MTKLFVYAFFADKKSVCFSAFENTKIYYLCNIMRAPKDSMERRLTSSYIMVIISISLMLYVLGLLLVFVINSNSLINNLRENIGIEVMVKDDYDEDELRFAIKQLYLKPYTKQVKLTTGDEAAEALAKELDEDFIGFIGYNPIPTSFEFTVKSEYSNPDSLTQITNYLKSRKYVQSVSTQDEMIERINRTKVRTGVMMMILVVIFTLINIIIINNTVKLSIDLNRKIITTQQTIGAEPSFIRRPYIGMSMFEGLIGAAIAIILLSVTLYAMIRYYSDIQLIMHVNAFIGVVMLIFVFGMTITFFTALFAVNKNIRNKSSY